MPSEFLFGRTGCVNCARPGLWGFREDDIPVLPGDRNGFCLWMKRLEEGRFPWPTDDTQAREIDREEVLLLLRGIDFWHEHRSLSYKTVL